MKPNSPEHTESFNFKDDYSETDEQYADNLEWEDELADEEDEDDTDFTEALKEAAWQVVRDNPGIECGEWIDTLIRQFPTEVVDALGTDPEDVYHILTDWWESEDYTDPDGINDTYQGLSEYYYNDVDCLHEQLDKVNHELYELRQALRSRDKEIKKLKNAIGELIK